MASNNRWFQQLQTAFYAVLMAQLLFAVVVWFLIRGRPVRYFMDAATDIYVVAGYAVCMVGGAWFIDQFRARTVARQRGIRERAASSYRATVYIRLAIITSATFPTYYDRATDLQLRAAGAGGADAGGVLVVSA